MYLVICPLMFFASFVDSIAGGGGLISLPAYLALGLPPQLAAGSNKMSASIGALFASFRYFKSNKIILFQALLSAAFALPGSYIGATIAQQISSNALKIIILCGLPIAAIAIFTHRKQSKRHLKRWLVVVLCAVMGFVIGMYDGLIGPGTGTFLIIGYTMIFGYDMATASGNAKVVNLSSNVAALISFWIGGNVLFLLAIPAGVFGIAGAWVGSGLAIKNGEKFIRPMLLFVMALIFIKIIWDIVSI
ncbi:MAG: TSUP family transporter [Clostridiales bacterium]|nr:TSUP family transporter [Clostridiales bacterium]